MSLLIKALDKAQNAKTEQADKSKKEQADRNLTELEIEADVSGKPHTKTSQIPAKKASTELELSLSPVGSEISEADVKPASVAAASVSSAPVKASSNQQSSQHEAAKSAANVFSAKGAEAKIDSARLAMIAGAGLIALLAMGLYFYQFVDSSPPIVVPARPLEQAAVAPPPTPEAQNTDTQSNVSGLDAGQAAASVTGATGLPPAIEQVESEPTTAKKANSLAATEEETMRSVDDGTESASEVTADKEAADNDDGANRLQASFSANKADKKSRISKGNSAIASESVSISITKSKPQTSVNPALMSAYQAYNTGKYAEAQQLYKQVLKRDIRNEDALLGLGAIAARQGRMADANGWYGEVLEVDPRNSIAKAAMLDSSLMPSQPVNGPSYETSLKNMLARQPDDANLHVALGNLYAEQNQWPAAQQAYFEAYRLNKTVDNAYNLAISLDQMDKSKLALPYYQQALAQATNTSNIDKAALQARINAIQ